MAKLIIDGNELQKLTDGIPDLVVDDRSCFYKIKLPDTEDIEYVDTLQVLHIVGDIKKELKEIIAKAAKLTF